MSKKNNATNTAPAQAPETNPESQEPENNPETNPESQEPDTAPAEAPEAETKKATKSTKGGKATDALPDFLAPYRKAYPTCRAFHVTSDRMVFLEADSGLARVHQNNLGSGEVKTYKVK